MVHWVLYGHTLEGQASQRAREMHGEKEREREGESITAAKLSDKQPPCLTTDSHSYRDT